MASFEFVHAFAKEHNKTWDNIIKGEVKTNQILERIQGSFPKSPKMFSSDVDLVVFGSLARNECTEKSDVDWTLVVDGQSTPDQYSLGNIVRGKLEEANLQEPGSSGMFGQISFGHDLIHYIGGEEDTNHNTSRRVLMLLESDNIVLPGSTKEGTAYERVLKGILNQYIQHDSGFNSERGAKAKVPRFLLNDIIRFWRTMCVDFAYKQKEQDGKKWALRNIKLRISRKLIYVKGLLMCISCYNNDKLKLEEIKEHLLELSLMKPLDVVLKVCRENKIDDALLVKMFDAYDEFLGLLNDKEKRDGLSNLKMLKVYESPLFLDSRKITDNFQDVLNDIFLNKETKIGEFTLKYGIF